MSSVTGVYDSTVQLLIPAIQAAATLVILGKQKDQYDDIADQRIELIDDSVSNYISGMNALLDVGLLNAAFGTVPAAAEYVPVNVKNEMFDTINENLQNIPAAERYIAAANRLNEQNDIARMVVFCPEFLHIAHKNSMTIRELMHGKLPIDSVINVMTDVAEQAQLNGRIGNTGRHTHRMLGLTRLQMQDKGRQLWGHHVEVTQRVSPVQRQASIQDMMSNPQNRLALALSQAQLIQQSLQNVNNAAAAGSPARMAQVQIEMQKLNARLGQEAQRGNMVNQFVPNYAGMLAPQINSISEALLGSGDRTGADTGGAQLGAGRSGAGQGNGKSNYFSTDPDSII